VNVAFLNNLVIIVIDVLDVHTEKASTYVHTLRYNGGQYVDARNPKSKTSRNH